MTTKRPLLPRTDDWRGRALKLRTARSWQAVVFLLGAETTSLVVWHVSGQQYSLVRDQAADVVSLLLGFAPVLTTLVALRAHWLLPPPAIAIFLVGLTLVGPGLIVVHLAAGPLLSQGLQGPGGLAVTPLCSAAAAGIAGALEGRVRRGSLLLLCGGAVGFVVLAMPMWLLGIGTVAECPVGCNSLEMRGIVGATIIVGVIALITMAPGFGIGWLIGAQSAKGARSSRDEPEARATGEPPAHA